LNNDIEDEKLLYQFHRANFRAIWSNEKIKTKL